MDVEFEISKWKAPRVLSFTLKSKSLNESVDFDVLPAYDALGKSAQTLAPEKILEGVEGSFQNLECWVMSYNCLSVLTQAPSGCMATIHLHVISFW